MDAKQRLEQLEEQAKALGVDVRYEPMTGVVAGAGGLCRIRGQYRVIIDRRLPASERAQVLENALAPLQPEPSKPAPTAAAS